MKPLDPRVVTHLRPARWSLLVTAVASALAALLQLGQAAAIGVTVARLVQAPAGSGWHGALITFAALAATRAVVVYVGDRAAARAAADTSSALRDRLLQAVVRRRATAPSSSGAGSMQASDGELTTLATRGIAAVEPWVTRYLPALAVAAALPLVTVVAIFVLDPLSGVIVLATLPLLPLFAALVGMSTRDKAEKQWRVLASLSGHFLDVVRGLPTLVAHRRARHQSGTIRSFTEWYRQASTATLRLAFASSAVLELVATISVALVAVNVGLRLAAGNLDLTTALVVLLLAPEAYWPIRRVGAEFHAAAEGTATFAAVDALLENEPTPTAVAAATHTAPPALTLAGLAIRYDGAATPAVSGLDANVPARSLTAIAGPSGCGKTTLLAALLGELPLSDGHLLLDGAALDPCTPDWLRRVAQAPQRAWLLPTTVAANLRVAAPAASDAELWQVLTEVDLHDVVAALPEGLETQLGDDGHGLSAGQRARLGLGRVVLGVRHGRDVVVLDEPTAHLDPGTERVLLATMRRLAGPATVIVVAHSAAVLDAADQVITLPGRPVVPEAALPVTGPTASADSPRPAPRPAPATAFAEPPAPSKWGLRTGVLLGVLSAAAGVALTATAGWLIVRASTQPPVLTLMVAIVGVRAFGLARPILRYAERLVSHDAALGLLAERRAQVYDALVPLVPGRLGRRPGDLLTSLVDDVDAELDRQLRVRLPLATAIGVSLIATTLAAIFDPLAALVLAVTIVLALLPAWTAGRRTAAVAEPALIRARAELSSQVQTLLASARQLVLWNAADRAVETVSHTGDRLAGTTLRSARGIAGGHAWAMASTALGTVAMALVVRDSSVSPAIAALLMLLPVALTEVLSPVADAAALSVRTTAAADRIASLTSQTPAVTDPEHPVAAPSSTELEVAHVSAAWGDRPALVGVDLNVPVGQRVAVVGPSGSGKSTLAALLLRFLDPSAGTVSRGGVCLRNLSLDDARREVGLVDDDPHVFASTLAENVRLARPEADDAEVRQALVAAHLGSWLDDLPDGLATMMGSGHWQPSGGERARIAIARALLADQPVLVLDEPTAHLDGATARAVATEVMSSGRTVVWMTHQQAGLHLADTVLVLPDPKALDAGQARPTTAEGSTRAPAVVG